MKKRFQKMIDPNTLVLIKHIGMGLLVFSIVALLLSGVWYGTRLEALTIATIEARGGETVQPDIIERLAENTLDGDYFGLIPYRFAWTYPNQKIKSQIEELERVYNVQIRREGGTELRITYDEHVPFALWCESVESEQCAFLDEMGYAFGHAPKLSGGAFLRFVTLGKEVALDQLVVDKVMYDNVTELVELLHEQSWFVAAVEIDQVGDVYVQLSGGGELKVTATDEPSDVVENLFVILSSDDFSQLSPGNFQYIDLRFGNKVFVNEELTTLESEEATTTDEDVE